MKKDTIIMSLPVSANLFIALYILEATSTVNVVLQNIMADEISSKD